MLKKVLITGASGFLGMNLAENYVKKGWKVFALDVVKPNLGEEIESIQCDMEKDDIGIVLKKISPDVVLHCAGNANVGLSISDPELDFKRNVNILHRILFSLKKELIICKFIFFSSAAVYGNPKKNPICEDDEIKPISPYGLHKKLCEEICEYFKRNENMDIVILRIFSAYGEGLKKQLFWDMYNKIINSGKLELFGTGNETRDFIYIEDLLEIIDLIINANKKEEYIFNVGNGREISIKEIAELFVKKMNLDDGIIKFNGEIKQGDPNFWRADISRIIKLGYKQKIIIEKGIDNYIGWVKNLK